LGLLHHNRGITKRGGDEVRHGRRKGARGWKGGTLEGETGGKKRKRGGAVVPKARRYKQVGGGEQKKGKSGKKAKGNEGQERSGGGGKQGEGEDCSIWRKVKKGAQAGGLRKKKKKKRKRGQEIKNRCRKRKKEGRNPSQTFLLKSTTKKKRVKTEARGIRDWWTKRSMKKPN